MRFAFSPKIFRALLRLGITLALFLLHVTVFSGRPRASTQAVFQESQQNQTTSEEKPSQDKPADSKKDSKPSDPTTTRLKIHVTAEKNPVANPTFYSLFPAA